MDLTQISHSSPDESLPALDIYITPRYLDGAAHSISVKLTFVDDGTEPRDGTYPVLRAVTNIASTPALHLVEGTLKVSDEAGDVPLTPEDASVPQIIAQIHVAPRKTRGLITVTYDVNPRQIDIHTRNGPLMDFRRQTGGGLMGAGYGMLAVPAVMKRFTVRMHWNLSDAPTGTVGVWTMGAKAELAPPQIQHTYFAVGLLKSSSEQRKLPSGKKQQCSVYWLTEPPFDADGLAAEIRKVFFALADFFEDQGDDFYVFFREHPYPGTGGTALSRSFMYTYSVEEHEEPEPFMVKLKKLAHEIVHEWATFNEGGPEENWYHEGLAEYYSLVFLHKLGILDDEAMIQEVNGRLSAYYTSPFVLTSNRDITKLTWASHTTQTLPYRRGFVFAILANAIIQQSTEQELSLDNLVLDLKRQLGSCPVGPDQYIDWITSKTGRDGRKMHTDMSEARSLLKLPDQSFPVALRSGKNLQLTREDQYPFDMGFDESTGVAKQVVQDLRPESRAWEAGLREGDRLRKWPVLPHTEYDSEVTLEVLRDSLEKPLRITYWPRGRETVESWQYSVCVD
ncbi:hypothetical protein PFICI_08548 [Pestalotiopsis fici W106-1]|uniref:Peptidase M61 catalytic domain-containing protein n=1 Tax=Pestalotiopsis fici (strain W106-1 / CGMCC3.15140) TaxID=1229662 RepID=W3WXX6_PESFW|nr:uncharacterized protein PFICI_08548 [Pestalotiopsis fici W106-1]ETS78695.1 hypothetical protein PFICI_08548 [Pestalotiopsis fici W106-1]